MGPCQPCEMPERWRECEGAYWAQQPPIRQRARAREGRGGQRRRRQAVIARTRRAVSMRVRVWYMYGLCTVSRDRRVRLPGASARFVGARAPGHAAHCRPINPGNTWARRRLGPIGAHAPKLLAGFCVEKQKASEIPHPPLRFGPALWFLVLVPLLSLRRALGARDLPGGRFVGGGDWRGPVRPRGVTPRCLGGRPGAAPSAG